MNKLSQSIAVAAALVLVGCSTAKQAERQFDKMAAQTDTMTASKPIPKTTKGAFYPDVPYVGVLSKPQIHDTVLPPRCASITYQKAEPITITQLAHWITKTTGLPVQVDPRALVDATGGNQGAGVPQFLDAPDSAGGKGSFPFQGMPVVMPPTLSSNPAAFLPQYTGPCAGLFDQAAAQFDLAWRYKNGVIYFDRFVTETFFIRAASAANKNNANISSASSSTSKSGGSGSSSGGGAGGQVSDVTSQRDVWGDVETAIQKMVQPVKGASYSTQRSTGTVTVVATPRLMQDVREWVQQINAVLGINIYVQVAAIYIRVDKEDDYGLDLEALWSMGVKGGLSLSTQGLLPTLSQTAGTGSLAILSPTNGSRQSHFAGTKVFLNAVSINNRLAEVRTGSTVCQNSAPTPIALTTDQDIVRSITFSTVAQAGSSSTAASAETINYGFSLQIIPRVVSSNEVNLFFTFNGTDLSQLKTFQVGTQGSVQLATIEKRNLWNELTVTSGQTIVIAGAEQDRVERDLSGTGDSALPIFGGTNTGKVTRTRLLLIITPLILNRGDMGPLTTNGVTPAAMVGQ